MNTLDYLDSSAESCVIGNGFFPPTSLSPPPKGRVVERVKLPSLNEKTKSRINKRLWLSRLELPLGYHFRLMPLCETIEVTQNQDDSCLHVNQTIIRGILVVTEITFGGIHVVR